MGNRFKIFLFVVGDAVALYLGLFLTLFIRYGADFYGEFLDAHALPFTVVFALWLVLFYVSGLYDLRRLRNNLDFIKTLFLAVAVNAVIAVLLFYLVPAFGIAPKTNLLIFIAVFAVVEIAWRRLANRLMTFGESPNRVLVIGDGPAVDDVTRTIRENPQLGYEIRAELGEGEAYRAPEALKDIARRERVTMIVVPHALKRDARLTRTLYELFGSGLAVVDLVAFYETIMRKVPLPDLEEAWLIENIAAEVRFYDQLKRAAEFLGALVLGIVLLPLELLIALLVRLTSRGPVIYKQVRVGEKERPFTLYKFRTMRVDAEKDGAVWASVRDPRATPIGHFLRLSHFDELPQLWNIVKGDISFVGPRPERPEFVEKLKRQIPYYEVRLLIKPGVTGWAQINYHKDATAEDVMQKLEYDIYYLKNRSIVLDWAIILKTLKAIVSNPE
ncbi:MAG TPA: sugar transferase [Candidatus Paceibacterota bacterium]|nr:sugar transferase [Candidatus Paceibacterota bacterium]